MLDPDAKNWLGTGLSMQEFFAARRVQEIQNSIIFQDREEERRRIELIVELAGELNAIRQRTNFSMLLAEGAIEDVIRGEWGKLREVGEQHRFEDESERIRAEYAPIYSRFVELCQKGFESRPGAEATEEIGKN